MGMVPFFLLKLRTEKKKKLHNDQLWDHASEIACVCNLGSLLSVENVPKRVENLRFERWET